MTAEDFYKEFINKTAWMELEDSFMGRNVLKAVKEITGVE